MGFSTSLLAEAAFFFDFGLETAFAGDAVLDLDFLPYFTAISMYADLGLLAEGKSFEGQPAYKSADFSSAIVSSSI